MQTTLADLQAARQATDAPPPAVGTLGTSLTSAFSVPSSLPAAGSNPISIPGRKGVGGASRGSSRGASPSGASPSKLNPHFASAPGNLFGGPGFSSTPASLVSKVSKGKPSTSLG